MKLTFAQKVLRPILNYLVETHFPSGAFYGRNYLRPFEKLDRSKFIYGGAAALYLVGMMKNKGADEVKITMEKVSSNGDKLGDLVLSISKAEGGDA